MTSPSSRRAGVVQGPQHAATGPEPSSGVGPALHLGEPEPPLRSYPELGVLPSAVPAPGCMPGTRCGRDADPRAPAPKELGEHGIPDPQEEGGRALGPVPHPGACGQGSLVRNRGVIPARRGRGSGREPPFVRINRPAEMGAAGQRGRGPARAWPSPWARAAGTPGLQGVAVTASFIAS